MSVDLSVDARLDAIRNITDNSVNWAQKVYEALNAVSRSTVNPFGSAATKDTGTSSGQIPVLGTGGKLSSGVIPDNVGADDLTDLDDFPDSYTGHGGKLAQVKAAEDGLEFASRHITGEIKAVAFITVPTGWLACDGRAVSRTTYVNLYTAIGTRWGSGNGSTTFNLPDFRRRTLIGSGGTKPADSDGPGTTVGATGGKETHTLTIDEMPAHDHTLTLSDNSYSVRGSAPINYSNPGNSRVTSLSMGDRGGDDPHNIMQPSAVVTYIIKI